MKNMFARLALAAALGSLLISIQPLLAQGTAFTYQGQLTVTGAPANGNYDFQFSLYNAASGGTQVGSTITQTATGVTNGLFTTALDFGAVFTGNATWLAMSVRSNNVGSYTAMTPLQQLTPVPYAIYAENAGNFSGTLPGSQLTSIGNTDGGHGNFFVGPSGNSTMSGSLNTANGYDALINNNVGSENTANGYAALYDNMSGNSNTATGFYAMVNNSSGSFNTADGVYALRMGASGINNIALGYNAGSAYTANESSNIDIGNVGSAGENNTIRIGSNQTTAYIAGVITGNGSGLTNLSAAQLTGSSEVAPPANGYPILNMVYIVPGTFVMGAPTSDPDYTSDETQHVVTLTNGFWMGQHPVTQGEYLAVMGNNPSAFTGDLSRPVESVTWFNAGTFCTNLTQNEQSAGRLPSGWVYRLPTESEWEYCCRALTTSRYYFGNDPGDGTSLTNYAWYSVNSGNTTQPVGQLLPNAWGLVDMAGNVFEWCQDWYGTYPTANVSYNPRGPATGSYRVLRGGSWGSPAGYCRSAARYDNLPTLEYDFYGFRVVLAPGP